MSWMSSSPGEFKDIVAVAEPIKGRGVSRCVVLRTHVVEQLPSPVFYQQAKKRRKTFPCTSPSGCRRPACTAPSRHGHDVFLPHRDLRRAPWIPGAEELSQKIENNYGNFDDYSCTSFTPD